MRLIPRSTTGGGRWSREGREGPYGGRSHHALNKPQLLCPPLQQPIRLGAGATECVSNLWRIPITVQATAATVIYPREAYYMQLHRHPAGVPPLVCGQEGVEGLARFIVLDLASRNPEWSVPPGADRTSSHASVRRMSSIVHLSTLLETSASSRSSSGGDIVDLFVPLTPARRTRSFCLVPGWILEQGHTAEDVIPSSQASEGGPARRGHEDGNSLTTSLFCLRFASEQQPFPEAWKWIDCWDTWHLTEQINRDTTFRVAFCPNQARGRTRRPPRRPQAGLDRRR